MALIPPGTKEPKENSENNSYKSSDDKGSQNDNSSSENESDSSSSTSSDIQFDSQTIKQPDQIDSVINNNMQTINSISKEKLHPEMDLKKLSEIDNENTYFYSGDESPEKKEEDNPQVASAPKAEEEELFEYFYEEESIYEEEEDEKLSEQQENIAPTNGEEDISNKEVEPQDTIAQDENNDKEKKQEVSVPNDQPIQTEQNILIQQVENEKKVQNNPDVNNDNLRSKHNKKKKSKNRVPNKGKIHQSSSSPINLPQAQMQLNSPIRVSFSISDQPNDNPIDNEAVNNSKSNSHKKKDEPNKKLNTVSPIKNKNEHSFHNIFEEKRRSKSPTHAQIRKYKFNNPPSDSYYSSDSDDDDPARKQFSQSSVLQKQFIFPDNQRPSFTRSARLFSNSKPRHLSPRKHKSHHHHKHRHHQRDIHSDDEFNDLKKKSFSQTHNFMPNQLDEPPIRKNKLSTTSSNITSPTKNDNIKKQDHYSRELSKSAKFSYKSSVTPIPDKLTQSTKLQKRHKSTNRHSPVTSPLSNTPFFTKRVKRFKVAKLPNPTESSSDHSESSFSDEDISWRFLLPRLSERVVSTKAIVAHLAEKYNIEDLTNQVITKRKV